MSPLLILSTIAISAALVFYTWGVFGERRSGTLTRKYVTLFWIGLACDTTGTLMMSSMAAQTAGGMGVHGITGIVAIRFDAHSRNVGNVDLFARQRTGAKALPHLQHGGLACLAHPLHHRHLDGYSCDPLESSVRCWYERDRRCDSERAACAPPPPSLSVGRFLPTRTSCYFHKSEAFSSRLRCSSIARSCSNPLTARNRILLPTSQANRIPCPALQFPKALLRRTPGCAGNR